MVAVRLAALVSDESALEVCTCSRRCAIQIEDLLPFLDDIWQTVHLWAPVMRCVRWGSLPPRGKANPQPVASCTLQPGE